MSNFSRLIVTNVGKELLNTSFTTGNKITFTRAVTSEQKYEVDALAGLTELSSVQDVALKNVSVEKDCIKIQIEFDNVDLKSGYILQTLGVYAKLENSTEVLFAASKEETESAYIPSRDVAASGLNIKVTIFLDNTENVQVNIDPAGVATLLDVQFVDNHLNNHMSDNIIHVNEAERNAWDSTYEQSTGYTDQKIADLIGGAPETLDTLKEISDAIAENDSVVEALNAAIGVKANQAELDTHTSNIVMHVTQSERSKWITTDNIKSTLLDRIYPVGSIYISVNSTNPGMLFGGTWEQLQNRFLLAAGSEYAAGNTGGEAVHKLTESELPQHRHSIPALSGKTSDNGDHNHSGSPSGVNFKTNSWVSGNDGNVGTGYNGTTATNGKHSHSISTDVSNTGYAGGADAHNNMPPYLAVYMWKRTA